MNKYRIVFEGKTYEMEVELLTGNVPQPAKAAEVKTEPVKKQVATVDNSPKQKAPESKGTVLAPIPGTVIKINKSVGDAVKAGDVVLVLEAMKMENEVVAPINGKLKQINASVGKAVAGGELLFEVE